MGKALEQKQDSKGCAESTIDVSSSIKERAPSTRGSSLT